MDMTPHFPIYLDYGATTPVDPRVVDAMVPWLREHFGNAASRSHAWGWEAEEAIEKARGQVADLIVSVDEPIDATQCGGKENCLGESGRCMTHDLWAALNQRMVEFLDSVSLQKLVDEQIAKGIQIEDKPVVRRAISTAPVVKPIRVNAPNSVFALGNAFAKS